MKMKEQEKEENIQLKQQDEFSMNRIQNLDQEVQKVGRLLDEAQQQND